MFQESGKEANILTLTADVNLLLHTDEKEPKKQSSPLGSKVETVYFYRPYRPTKTDRHREQQRTLE